MQAQSLLGLNGLADLGMRSGAHMRPTLLRILTDLYVQKLKHTPDEERHYAELALRLLDDVDVPTRIDVATRLACHLSPPVRVVERLAADLPEVAAAIGVEPSQQELVPVSGAAPVPTAAALAEDGAEEEAEAEGEALRAVIDTATANELNELFFAASAIERRLILLNLETVAPTGTECSGISPDPSVSHRLEAAALARRLDDFAQCLGCSLRIPHEQARRIAADTLGEPVVVAGKALGVPHDVLYRLLIFVNPAVGHSVERVHALAVLYDELPPPAALGMIAIWQALPRQERGAIQYQPVTSDGATRAHARSAPLTHRASPLQVPVKARAERA